MISKLLVSQKEKELAWYTNRSPNKWDTPLHNRQASSWCFLQLQTSLLRQSRWSAHAVKYLVQSYICRLKDAMHTRVHALHKHRDTQFNITLTPSQHNKMQQTALNHLQWHNVPLIFSWSDHGHRYKWHHTLMSLLFASPIFGPPIGCPVMKKFISIIIWAISTSSAK